MNIQQAKQISIVEFLAKLGIEPRYNYPKSRLYLSPVRNERKASFSVSTDKNLWFDLSTGEGGTIIDLAKLYFNCSVSEALANIEQTMNAPQSFSFNQQKEKPKDNSIKIHRAKDLQNQALVSYLESRCIPVELAKKYVKEVYYYIEDRHQFALGWENERGGWELRNKYAKRAYMKAISFIKGATDSKEHLNVFEGFLDFLSALIYFGKAKPLTDTIILNSIALVRSTLPMLKEYSIVSLFLDNDKDGDKATEHIKSEHQGAIDRRYLYSEHNDFNDHLCSK